MKRKTTLIALILVALALPIARASPADGWLIENAITEVKLEHPEHQNVEFTGTITSNWHDHGVPWHKHVTLDATFGYMDTGTIRWEGRSYLDGGIYTTYYSNHNPEVPKIHTKVVYLGPAEYWDGSHYVTNHPQSIRNSGDAECTVLVLGTNGLSRTYELKQNYSLLVYPPIGVRITLSILT